MVKIVSWATTIGKPVLRAAIMAETDVINNHHEEKSVKTGKHRTEPAARGTIW
jgi:hypothetical protein